MIHHITKQTMLFLLFFLVIPAITNTITSPPNIIFILADDLGYGDVEYNGNVINQTPNLNRLASQSTILSNYYSPASVCTPTRGSILTGKYFRRLGLYPGVLSPYSIGGMNSSHTTFVKHLHASGYTTGMIGKWHLGVDEYGPWNPKYGFDYYYGLPMTHDNCLNQENDGLDGYCPIFNQEKIIIQDRIDLNWLDQNYTNTIKKWIKEFSEPYFIYYATHHVHLPQYPNNSFQNSINVFDDMVGEVIDNLKDNGTNTVIIMTSDNGASLWGELLGGSNQPFRCGKGSTWEGGHRVPSLIYSPKIIPAIRNPILITGLDWFDTILGIANISNANSINTTNSTDSTDGYNMWDNIRNGNITSPRKQFYYHSIREFGSIHSRGAIMAVRYENYKLNLYTTGGNCLDRDYDQLCRGNHLLTKSRLLYDLSRDTGERYPLDLSNTIYEQIADQLEKMILDEQNNFIEEPSQILRGVNKDRFPCANPDCNPHPECCRTT